LPVRPPTIEQSSRGWPGNPPTSYFTLSNSTRASGSTERITDFFSDAPHRIHLMAAVPFEGMRLFDFIVVADLFFVHSCADQERLDLFIPQLGRFNFFSRTGLSRHLFSSVGPRGASNKLQTIVILR
jgi:hypothetical protein